MSITGDAGRHAQAIGGSSSNREGVPLAAVIGAVQRLDELSTARVLCVAAEAVHKAQVGGQPLGTLSPTAIVLAPDGNVKLEAAASVAHSAPEKLRGQPCDRRSDVFSLGVLLWEALAHVPLFAGATDDARKTAVLQQEIRPPSELNANVPAELDAICKKALARDPADRYHSAKVMAAELSTVLDDAGYAETNDEIVKYLAANFSASAVPAKPAAAKSGLPAATTLGMAPIKPAGTEPPPNATQKPATIPPPLSPMAFAKPSAPAPAPAPLPSLTKTMMGGSNLSAPKPVDPPKPEPKPGETALLGSNLAGADPTTTLRGAAPAAPLVPKAPVLPPATATKTPALGSQATVDDPAKTATFGSSASTPMTAAPAADSAKHALPGPKPSIANAETVETPALAATAATVTSIPGLPAMPPGSTIPPYANDDFATADGAKALPPTHAPATAAAAPDPAAVVSLPPAPERGDKTGQRDVLAGWGWTTGSTPIIEGGDDYEESASHSSRKRLFIAVGAAAGALLLIVIIAMAAGGGSKDKAKDAPKEAALAKPETAPTVAPTEPPAEPVAKAPDPAPVADPPPAVDPQVAAKAAADQKAADEAAAKQAKADEEAAAKQAKADEEAAAKQAKLDAEKQAKADAAAAKQAAKEEAARKKAELAAQAKKTEPKKTEHKAEPKRIAAGKPIDPYATPEKPKTDPATVYKTGFQQYVRGDTSGALATFRASLSSSPGYAPTWRGLGLVYEKLGNKTQAKGAFRRYLQLSPGASDAEQIRDRIARL